uniref:Doublesex female isoform n=1 Tax=Asobara tabida TaxID=58720 RepID=A0A291B0E2_ASOTA|nr:doublesex female isoform [Asobara tabida]
MNQDNETSPAGSDTKSAEGRNVTLIPRTKPNCARCGNHHLKMRLRGHKRYCKYRYCTCEKCILTTDRQKVMALQTALRRAQEQDATREEPQPPYRATAHISVSQPARSLPKNCDSSSADEPFSNVPIGDSTTSDSVIVNISRSRKLPQPDLVNIHPPTATQLAEPRSSESSENVGLLLDYSVKLLEQFWYSWEGLPLMYVILKDAKADLDEARRRIAEAVDTFRDELTFDTMVI